MKKAIFRIHINLYNDEDLEIYINALNYSKMLQYMEEHTIQYKEVFTKEVGKERDKDKDPTESTLTDLYIDIDDFNKFMNEAKFTI